MKEKDIVEDIFFRVKNILGHEFKGEIVLKLEEEEQKIRQDWGGTEPYIPKKKKGKANQDAITALKNGDSIKKVVNDVGISRRQVYLLLKRNH